MYRIGEFSYLCEATMKTLRHYDKINLLKPVMVDEITGYRYYSEEQVELFYIIKQLQSVGFTLAEIKQLMNHPDQSKLDYKLEQIQKENLDKVEILTNMKNKIQDKSGKVGLIKNPNYLIIGKFVRLKTRKDYQKVLNKIDKKINYSSILDCPEVFLNYEKIYKEKDITCFIGREITKYKNHYDLIHRWQSKKLIVLNHNKVGSMLHIKTEEDIDCSYQQLIQFANKNNIQIRGEFQEYHHDNKTDIYVEAYDLKVENKEEIEHHKYLEKNLEKIHPKKYIGNWILQGEIVELPRIFNPRKNHTIPETKLVKLTLNPDGTTNFKNFTWQDNYLIQKENNKFIYHPFYIHKKWFRTYLIILIGSKYSNARPYQYYYKKG